MGQEAENRALEGHEVKVSLIEKGIGRTQRLIFDILSFLRPAPKIESIDPNLQELNFLKLISLMVKEALGKPLTFTEEKKLRLSTWAEFRRNVKPGEATKLGIDKRVMPLVETINTKPYFFSVGSCSGHLRKDERDPQRHSFSDSGFIGFAMDQDDGRSQKFISALKELCVRETEAQEDCRYSLEVSENGKLCFLNWRWNHPIYNEFHAWEESIFSKLRAGEKIDDAETDRQQDEWFGNLERVAHLAEEQNIPQKHDAFIQKAADFIKSYLTSSIVPFM